MEQKVFYLTKKKLKELQKEYEVLKKIEHEKMTSDEIPRVFESENFNPEFISFQEDLNFIRTRLDELKNILDNCVLITPPPKEKRKFVDLGAKVKVEIDGETDEFMIVGTLEADPSLGKISNESPVGKALIGHKVGDVVLISSPVEMVYKIKSIKYQIS